MSAGGQRRTLGCACGFTTKGAPREANMRMKMHQKKCELGADIPIPSEKEFNPLKNGFDGIRQSRNGNLVQNPIQLIRLTQEDRMTMSVEDFKMLQAFKTLLKDLD